MKNMLYIYVSKKKEMKFGLIIDERKLNEIDGIMKKISDNVSYEVECTDDTSIEFGTLNDLINFPNHSHKQIKRLEISNGWNKECRVAINLRNSDYSPIDYRVSGEEREVDFHSRKIEDFLSSLKPWYGFIESEKMKESY